MLFNQFKIKILFVALLMTGITAHAAAVQICNEEICQPITSFEQQQVMEKLVAMFQNKTNQILICAADPFQKRCLNQPLTFQGQTNLMHVDFQVPFVRVLQKERLENALVLTLNYQVKANEKYPLCSASVSHFTLFPKGEIELTSPSFECHATELGNTFLAFQFKIDYINFETGWLGGRYKVSSSGDVLGQGSGYVMMQVSAERTIQLKRRQPVDSLETTGNYPGHFRSDFSDDSPSSSAGKMVDWDWDNIKEKWTHFKEKALKVIYLEPIDD
ncbi:MAG: hypothetical protein ACI4OR_02505 [Alphaproteobacteria bacterium]